MGCTTSAIASLAEGVKPVNDFADEPRTRIYQEIIGQLSAASAQAGPRANLSETETMFNSGIEMGDAVPQTAVEYVYLGQLVRRTISLASEIPPLEEVVDFCLNRNEFASNALGSMSNTKFTDGLLGVRDENSVIQKLGRLKPGELFRDENFPADRSSLSFSDPFNPEYDDVVWKRPCEISEDPRLFVDGTSRSDVKQGLLGNCWFLSACAAIATRQDLIEKVINPNQKLHGIGYQGVLVISFWRFGKWVKVYVDDRLPTRGGNLIYGSCSDSNEFWLSLVEKAFAKVHGSYEALVGGHALEAFVDLTGGIAEKFEIKPGQFSQLQTIFKHGAFITCSRKSENGGTCGQTEETDANGLIEGHAYTVTSVASMRLLDGVEVNLVRIRNPWGNSVEWKGDWNDKCLNWNKVSARDKERLRVAALADGEFWMDFEDFKDEFVDITVATLGPDFDQDGLIDTPRQMEIVRGSWIKGVNAGGSRNNLEKFSLNPQFLLHLKESDSNNNEDRVGKCSILVGLMQEHRRCDKDSKLEMLPISFFIYKAEKPEERLGPEYFLCVEEKASSGDFTNAREVIARAHLDQGYYVVIPATFYSDCETDFMIRIFALKPFTLKKIID